MLSPPIDRSNVHPGTGYLIVPRVPHGLAAIVEGLTREVLRHRPEDIYVFAADHFENLLKLREHYHAQEYNDREFTYEFDREFNLWPTKSSRDTEESSVSGLSVDETTEFLERHRKILSNIKKRRSLENLSTYNKSEEIDQAYSNSLLTAKRARKKSGRYLEDNEETLSRAMGIISQISAVQRYSRDIQTKDIKHELRKNRRLSGEKTRATDTIEKEIRDDRRSRRRSLKSDKEDIERTTNTSSRASSRKSSKKIRQVEVESETETEHDTAMKITGNRYKRSVDNVSRETSFRSGSKERKAEMRHSEHSSGRKVFSRALSMDRIRAYVLRKFASRANPEVLRSPTYVEQVQNVIDCAVPIIREKLEEMRMSLEKRSRSVDLDAWDIDEEYRYVRERRKSSGNSYHGEVRRKERVERDKSASMREQEDTVMMKEDIIPSPKIDENLSMKRNEAKEEDKRRFRRHSVGSGKKSKSYEIDDIKIVDQTDDNSKHELNVIKDTLAARSSNTQSILEDITMSASQLSGTRKLDDGENEYELMDSTISDHMNGVSLPIVRPSSSRNSRSAARTDSDNLTLPPISPEAPKSAKKKDQFSLPILSNGNNSAQEIEQNDSKDIEEASTMRDITSDIEDIAILPEDGHENVIIVSAIQNLTNDKLTLDRSEETNRKAGMDEVMRENTVTEFAKKHESIDQDFKELEEFARMEEKQIEEIFRDSLNVTPEVIDIPHRPDSLEPDENQIEKLQDDNADTARANARDGLKGKLIEIETAERNIEKALDGQQSVTYDVEGTNQVENSMAGGKINEAVKFVDEAEEIMNEMKESTNQAEKLPIGDKIAIDAVKEQTKETEELKSETGRLINELRIDKTEISMKAEKESMNIEDGIVRKTEMNKAAKLSNKIEKSAVNHHVKNIQSIDTNSQHTNNRIVKIVADETGKQDASSSSKSEISLTKSSKTTAFEKVSNVDSTRKVSAKDNIDSSKSRRKRDTDRSPATRPLSLEIPYSYILSEGSPCEIPDSVTTVIIPDKDYQSSVIDKKNQQLDERNSSVELAESVEESLKNVTPTKEEGEYGMEIFGEYIRPEMTALPVDIDFVRGMKSNQEIIILHQDLDKIKEEEEEERDQAEEKKHHVDKEDNKNITQHEEGVKIKSLEDIMEHEENENRQIVSKLEGESLPFQVSKCESLPDTVALIADSNLTDEVTGDIIMETKSILDNSSQGSESTQDTHTTTSSDTKENRSVESSSVGRPIVPELNLDSLQDNTVSSFKTTADGTMKESNDSPRESDATISLTEPLTSDERLMIENRIALSDHEEEARVEELKKNLLKILQTGAQDADQPLSEMEYESLEKNSFSSEINPQGDTETSSRMLQVDPIIREKEDREESASEEEIARELIESLDQEMQHRAEKLDLKKEHNDNLATIESNLSMNEEFNSSSEVARLISADILEEKKQEISLKELKILNDEENARNEQISESATNIKQDDETDARVDGKTARSELKLKKDEHVDTCKVTSSVEQVEFKKSVDQERSEDKQLNDDMAVKCQGNDITNKAKEIIEERKESSFITQEEFMQENLEVQDNYKQEILKVQEEHERNKLKIQRENDREDFKIGEKITNGVPLEIIETRKESLKDDDNDKRDRSINEPIIHYVSITDNNKTKDIMKDEEREEVKDRSTEVMHVDETIIDTNDRSYDRYCRLDTRSSTVETVIAASDVNNTNTEERTKTPVDTPEIIESRAAKNDDFFLAAIKIQACIRGFLARHRIQKDQDSEFVLPTQKTIANEDFTVPQDHSNLQEIRSRGYGRQYLRREKALLETTLSLDNAFATGRLQHTGEFHDCLPLPLHDGMENGYNSIVSNNDTLDGENEDDDIGEDKSSNMGKSTTNVDDHVHSAHDGKQQGNFQKGTAFVDCSAFPIVMHLLTDVSRNCHFKAPSREYDFNSNVETRSTEPAVDILMLGCPKDETILQDRYLNFITSVEDVSSNLDSSFLDDTMRKCPSVTKDASASMTSENSLKEPLALPGSSQGVVIEEVTSMEETGVGESMKSESIATKIRLDTNSPIK